ncbi:MAG: HDOD domain-containing protein [Myxococcota bacterium]
MTRRVLFVDDERHVLNGLRGLLRRYRGQWRMDFVDSAEQALLHMTTEPVDVLVTDVRMPGMDGTALLETVEERHPDVVRIVLSGHVDEHASLRAVPVAHQYLDKPCEPERLENVVERACRLQDLLHDPGLRQLLGSTDALPSCPRIYSELVAALRDPDVSLDELGAIVEQDVAMTAKIFQIVNSAFFGTVRRVSSVRQAVTFLGTRMLRNLVLSVEVFRAFEPAPDVPGFSIGSLQRHALRTGRVASRLVARRDADDAFMAGMLHDAGYLLLASRLSGRLAVCLSEAERSGRPAWEVEQDVLGYTHAEVGAYLLGLWGLPHPIVEAVAHHHVPRRVESTVFDLVAAVHVADRLSHECCAAEAPDACQPELDHGLLDDLGVAERLPDWREEAGRVLCGGVA